MLVIYLFLTFDPAVIDETDVTNTLKPVDVLTAEKLRDKMYVQDYERLGFGTPGSQLPARPKQGEAFRISEVNIHFELARRWVPSCGKVKKYQVGFQ